MILDLTIPENAYMFGFFQTDGHLYENSRNRGKLTLELNERDKHILYDFQKLIPCYSSIRHRTRDTNFKDACISYVLTVCDLSFRTAMNELGIPYGKKSELQKPPTVPYSELDYIRGIIDANGSVGITSQNLPFISFTTYSDSMADYFKLFIKERIGVIKRTKRNSRDNIYNILLLKENAIEIINLLYPRDCLSLKRKYDVAKIAVLWSRPQCWRAKTTQTPWSEEQDTFIKSHTVKESVDFLKRSKSSINMRLWRIRNV